MTERSERKTRSRASLDPNVGRRYAAAWKAWSESDEGKAMANPDGCLSRPGPYLENRLFRAFMAGASNADPHASGVSAANDR